MCGLFFSRIMSCKQLSTLHPHWNKISRCLGSLPFGGLLPKLIRLQFQCGYLISYFSGKWYCSVTKITSPWQPMMLQCYTGHLYDILFYFITITITILYSIISILYFPTHVYAHAHTHTHAHAQTMSLVQWVGRSRESRQLLVHGCLLGSSTGEESVGESHATLD